MELVIIRKGLPFTIEIDDQDKELISGIPWRIQINRYGNKYVKGRCSATKTEPYLHRLLLGVKKGQFVDHVDGNGLNNKRSNLRVCSQRENNYNVKPKGALKLKGVSTVKSKAGKISFHAAICKDGISFHLGVFKVATEAAKAYDNAAREYYGEFAWLNFPNTEQEAS